MRTYIYIKITVSSAEGGNVLQPWRKTTPLLIVSTASVSLPCHLFSFGRLDEAKLQEFAVPMAAK